MNTEFDLVIVGAGIVGAFAAYMAGQRHTNLRILLLDRSLVGSGATQYSLGLDYPYGHTTLKHTMTKESMAIWDHLRSDLSDLQRELPLYGLVSADKLSKVQAGLINKSEINSGNNLDTPIQPILQEDQYLIEGLNCKYNHTREIALRLAQLFCGMSEKNILWEGIEVNGINPTTTGFSLDLTCHPPIKTKKLFLATGPWMPDSFFMGFFEDIKIRTKKIVSLFIDRSPQLTDPGFFFFDEDAFLLPMVESSRWMLSFTVYAWDCDPNATRWPITQDERQLGLSVLEKYVPEFMPYCHGGRAFCDSYHHDWTPIISQSADYENLVLATGGSGSGFRLAPSMATRALNNLGL